MESQILTFNASGPSAEYAIVMQIENISKRKFALEKHWKKNWVEMKRKLYCKISLSDESNLTIISNFSKYFNKS